MSSVAVIMSVYRSDELSSLKSAIDSILNQSHYNLKLYLYSDGPISSEMDFYLNQISNSLANVKYCRGNKNHGLAYSLNFLIAEVLSDGGFDYIARMDSDDISDIKRIETQVNFFKKNRDVDVCGTLCREFGADFSLEEKALPLEHDDLLSFSITRCPFIHPTVMFRTSVFKNGIKYPTDTVYTEDMALWLLLLDSGYRFANINKVLLEYRLNQNTLLRRKGIDKALSEVKLRFKYMIKLKQLSFRNVLLIAARLVFHLMPSKLVAFAYKNLR